MMSHEYDDTRKYKLRRFHLTWLSMTLHYTTHNFFSMILKESTIFIFHVGGSSRDVKSRGQKTWPWPPGLWPRPSEVWPRV